MKKLGISIDGIIRNYHESFDKQYKKVFVHNPHLVDMDEEFKLKEPSEQELEERAVKMQKETENRISLPIDTPDLLNHYQFDEVPEFENKNSFKTPKDSEFLNWGASGKALKMDMEMGNKILSPEEALNQFMYEKYPFKIFGDAEEFQNAMSYFNRIQAFGLRNKLFETVLLSDLKSNAISANYYFLHKVGSRARNIQIVEDTVDKWNYCDVLVDVLPEVFQNKPEGKVAIKIDREYNQWDGADYTMKSLKDVNNEVLLKKLFK